MQYPTDSKGNITTADAIIVLKIFLKQIAVPANTNTLQETPGSSYLFCKLSPAVLK